MSSYETSGDDLLAELEETADRERELVDLVRLDYDAALGSISGFASSGAQLRGIGTAAWGVVLGLAVRDESALLAGLAAVLLVLFAYGDAYHGALYRRSLSRAISLEGLLDAYVDRLGIDAEDPEARLRLRARLETHRFGVHRTLKPVRTTDLLKARPRLVFRAIYPALLVATVAAALVYAL